MWALRLLLLAGCLGAIVLSAATVSWEGRLVRGDHSWLMNLGRHPIWQPPHTPDYQQFRQQFQQSKEFPPPNGEWVIQSSYYPADVGLMAIAFSWPINLVCGLIYRVVRGSRRDAILHCALSAAAGVSLAAVANIGLWCIVGGWNPPMLVCFGVLGLGGGLVRGMASFKHCMTKPTTPQTGGA